jgi:hypothetical protein
MHILQVFQFKKYRIYYWEGKCITFKSRIPYVKGIENRFFRYRHRCRESINVGTSLVVGTPSIFYKRHTQHYKWISIVEPVPVYGRVQPPGSTDPVVSAGRLSVPHIQPEVQHHVQGVSWDDRDL